MDERVRASLHARLRAALAAALRPELHAHPDARALFEAGAPAGLDERVLLPLVDVLGLSPIEHAAVALALWVELDAALAAAICLLQGSAAHAGASRPTLGLVASLANRLDADGGEHIAPSQAMSRVLQGTAVACGLLQLGDAQPLAHGRALRLPPALVAILAGEDAPQHATALGRLDLAPLALPAWPLPRAWLAAVASLAATLSDAASARVVVLRGADREELCALAATLAAWLGRSALEIRGTEENASLSSEALGLHAAREAVVPAMVAARGLPVWHPELAPGSTIRIPVLPHWPGPFVVLGGSDSVFETALPMHEFELSLPDAADRRAIWSVMRRRNSGAAGAGDLKVVARSRCGISVLAQAAVHAGADVPARAAIEQAVRASARSLSAWAQVSTDRIPADAWVGPPEVHRELGLLLTRCLARADAGAQLGPLLRGRLSHGVKSLFIGASGTGKTLTAQWLADRLARPLVRVDLAAVVSKYIGETEKNLAHLLSRAEHLDAVLLFDEADSLFGARTDVKQANDRYANMQTNYLLQRLETFHGVAVLTSNSKARFDDAFLRRLDAVVEFPLPDVAERRALWSLHLGAAPALDPGVLDAIAALVDLPGGHIRNAVLTAALLARQRRQDADGDADESESIATGLHADDLREALALEYRKLGQRPPDSL